MLVALERNRVVGFALTSPAVDPDCDPVADGELAEVTLDPAERAKGHGSRLLQAAVDTLAADRFTRAVTWVNAGDDALLHVPHRGRLGPRHGPPRARPRRHRHDDGQAGPAPHGHRLTRDRRLPSRVRTSPLRLLDFRVTRVTMDVRPLRRVQHGGSTCSVRFPRSTGSSWSWPPSSSASGIGFWFGVMPEVPLNLRVGLLVGTAAGAAAAFVLVHDFHQRQSRPARARRRAH